MQQAFSRICFDPSPSPDDLALLHDADERWLLYRGMVRSRLTGMVRSGLPRSSELLGDERLEAAVASWLAGGGPRSRFIRQIVDEVVEHSLSGWQADPDLPPHTSDLVRFEATKWRVGALEWTHTAPVTEELDFEGIPVLNPTVESTPIRYRVDKSNEALDEPRLLLAYRKPGGARIFVYVLNPMGAELYEAWRVPERSFADGVRAVLAAHAREPDARFIDGMAGVLAELVGETVIVGSAR